MDDRAYVESQWERLHIGQPTNSDFDGEFRLVLGHNKFVSIETTAEKCWKAAADFTRNRKQQIKDLDEEIEAVRTILDCYVSHGGAVWRRIHGRLLREWNALREGMKTGT